MNRGKLWVLAGIGLFIVTLPVPGGWGLFFAAVAGLMIGFGL